MNPRDCSMCQSLSIRAPPGPSRTGTIWLGTARPNPGGEPSGMRPCASVASTRVSYVHMPCTSATRRCAPTAIIPSRPDTSRPCAARSRVEKIRRQFRQPDGRVRRQRQVAGVQPADRCSVYRLTDWTRRAARTHSTVLCSPRHLNGLRPTLRGRHPARVRYRSPTASVSPGLCWDDGERVSPLGPFSEACLLIRGRRRLRTLGRLVFATPAGDRWAGGDGRLGGARLGRPRPRGGGCVALRGPV